MHLESDQVVQQSYKNGFIKTDAHSSFNFMENEYVQVLRNVNGNTFAPKQEIYIDENKKYSPRSPTIN